MIDLLSFSDEESEGSLPGSSDVSPRNAPSVHRIVNRCVSIVTLNAPSLHSIVNKCMPTERNTV